MDPVLTLEGRRTLSLRVVIVMGPAGCGKTTVGSRLAERLGWDFLDADALHPAQNIEKMGRGVPLSDEDRRPWLNTLRDHIHARGPHLAHPTEGRPQGERALVLACSALKRSYRERLNQASQSPLFVYLHLPRETLAARLEAREGHFANAGLLESQLQTLEPPDEEDRRLGIDFIVLDGTQESTQLVQILSERWAGDRSRPRCAP